MIGFGFSIGVGLLANKIPQGPHLSIPLKPFTFDTFGLCCCVLRVLRYEEGGALGLRGEVSRWKLKNRHVLGLGLRV